MAAVTARPAAAKVARGFTRMWPNRSAFSSSSCGEWDSTLIYCQSGCSVDQGRFEALSYVGRNHLGAHFERQRPAEREQSDQNRASHISLRRQGSKQQMRFHERAVAGSRGADSAFSVRSSKIVSPPP